MNRVWGVVVRVALLLVLICLVSGCALLPGMHPKNELKAQQAAQRIRQTNHDILTSRGTGNLSLMRNGRMETYRVAWVAKWPRCLRMTLLTLGIPVETIAADGESVTFVSHTGSHAPHTLKQPNPSLEAITSLPVKLGDIIALLTGKIPWRGGNNVTWNTDELNASHLFFKNWWGRPTQKIFLNDTQKVIGYWQLSSDALPEVKLSFDQFNRFDGYTIARKTVFTDSHDRQLILQITSFTPNVDLKNKDHLFHLTESGS